MHPRRLLALSALLGSVLLSACGARSAQPAAAVPPPATATVRPSPTVPAASPTQAPSPTQPPPTAQPSPTVVPSPTPIDPAAVARTLDEAYERTLNLDRALLNAKVTLSDDPGHQQAWVLSEGVAMQVRAGYAAAPPRQAGFGTITMLYDAIVVGGDSKGSFVAAVTSGAERYNAQTIDVTRVGDDTYMYCPCIARSLGDPEDTWYLVPVDSARMAQLPLAGQELLPLALDWVDFAGMEPRGEQALADQVCTAYGGTRDDAAAVIDGLLAGMSPEGSLLGGLLGDQPLSHVDMTLSVCPDGYLRQIDVSLSGDLLQLGQQVSVSASLRVQTPPPGMTITAPPVFKPYPADTSGAGTATVFNGGNIRAEPDLNGEVYGQLHAGETVTVVAKTPDGRWYFVNAPEANGWVSVTLLTLDSEVAAAVPVYEAEGEELVSGGPTATVFNGGNVREMPGVEGAVLDQIHAFEEVALLSRTADGLWWKIRNPRGVTGWVHRSLLTISDSAAQAVPVE